MEKPHSIEALRADVEQLVSRNQLREAVERMQALAAASGRGRNEVTLLQRQLTALEETVRLGTARREELETEQNRIAVAILKVYEQLAPPPAEPTRRPLDPAEKKARGVYLERLRRRIKTLQEESIHNARLIDLGIANTPAAVPPLFCKDADTGREFGTVAAAFAAYDRRLLILGSPGAGKSFMLLQLTHDLIAQAEESPDAPIPLLVNLSKFQFAPSGPRKPERVVPGAERAAEPDRSFEAWLVDEFAEWRLSRSVGQRWVREGRVAALLDGLDEVNDERRAELVKLINTAYLHEHQESIVVVCSRVDEYRPLQDRKETRLELAGAITLQPLGPNQIEAYLEAAKASGLREALGRDKTLEELAQTPLTLSMMTLAYGGLGAEKIPRFTLAADYRHHLMEAYVARMLERKERRDRNIQLDDDTQEVKPETFRYSLEQVNRYLSWWAVRLSVRMQTAVALHDLHRFLARDEAQQAQAADARVAKFAQAMFLAVCMLIAVAPLALMHGGLLLAVPALALAYCVGAAAVRRLKARGIDLEPFIVLLAVPTIGLWLAAASHGIAALGPSVLDPTPAGMIALAGLIALFVVVLADDSTKWVAAAILGGTLVGLALGIAIAFGRWTSFRLDPLYVVAVSVMAGQLAGAGAAWLKERRFESDATALLFVMGALFALQWVVTQVMAWEHWNASVFICLIVAAGLVVLVETNDRPAAPAAGLALATAAGGIAGGAPGAELGASVAMVQLLLISQLGEKPHRFGQALAGWQKNLEEACQLQADHWLLTPAALLVPAALRRLPPRLRAFLHYAGQALMLKPYRGEIEFVHRRLRDYFALRELVPQLGKTASESGQAQLIRAIGFQGAAAIDLLAELIDTGTAMQRAVAVSAIARIAAPEVVNHMEKALRDPDAEVRSAVVANLRNVTAEKRRQILAAAVGDRDIRVQTAVIDAADPTEDLLPVLAERLVADEHNRVDILRHIATRSDNAWALAAGECMKQSAKNALEALLLDIAAPARAAACLWMGSNPALANVASIGILLQNDDTVPVRCAAALALSQLDDSRAVDLLIQALADRELLVRAAAARALGRLGDLRAVEALVRTLSHSMKGRGVPARYMSTFARLHGFVSRSELVLDPQVELCFEVAVALARLADTRAAQPLLQVAAEPFPVNVVADAALGELSGAEVVDALMEGLVRGGEPVRGIAAKQLGRLADLRSAAALIRALGDRPLVRVAAARSLRRIEDAASLMTSLGVLDAAESQRQVRDAPRADVLRRAASGRDPRVRREALIGLAEAHDVPAVIDRLSDSDTSLRRLAAERLGHLRDARAVDPLIAVLTNRDADLRTAAAVALGEIGDARAVGPLLQILSNTNRNPLSATALYAATTLHAAVATALGHLGDARAVVPLIGQLDAAEGTVRVAAARALRRLKDVRAIEPLTRALVNSSVAAAAAEALVAMADPRATAALVAVVSTRQSEGFTAAVEALRASGEAQLIDLLLAALELGAWSVRRAAAVSLGQMRDVRAREPLARALEDWDNDVRFAAAVALAELRDERAVVPLIAALNEHDLRRRYAAGRALGALRDPGVTQALRDCPSPALRRAFVHGYALTRPDADRALLSNPNVDTMQYWSVRESFPMRPRVRGSRLLSEPWTEPQNWEDYSWRDPHTTITALHVTRIARKLARSEDAVRASYEAMADDLGLRLAWKDDAIA